MRRISQLIVMAVASLLLVSASDAYGCGWGGYGYRSYGCGSYCGSYCGSCCGSYYGGGYYGGGYYGGGYYGRGYYGGGSYYGRGYYGRGYYGGGYYGGGSYYWARPYYGGFGRSYGGYGGYYRGYGFGAVRRVVSQPATVVASADSRVNQSQARATLNVDVPENATIYVNGKRTTSTGKQRVYVAPLMKDNPVARFEVRAVVNENGQTAEETQVATVEAGRTGKLSFDLSRTESVQTSLTLNIPADASVQIEGREIAEKGPRLVLASKAWRAGERWEDVAVRVSLDRNGKTITQEQKITLVGGQQHELTFEFDDVALAKR